MLQEAQTKQKRGTLKSDAHRWDKIASLRSRGLIYKGIYAQKMAYASFYAMFAIYKILT